MTQEYTGEEFRAPFCEALAKGPVEWECLSLGEWCALASRYMPTFEKGYTYRFKPMPKRMVTMYDKHGKPHLLVAPERENPQLGQFIYIHDQQAPTTWQASSWQEYLLYQRLIFLTREDAQAMADFQREQREGVV